MSGSEKYFDKALEQRARLLGLPLLTEAPKIIPKDAIDIISEDIAKRHKLAAFAKENKVVRVGMVNPEDVDALNLLRFLSENAKVDFEIYLIAPELYEKLLELYSGGAEKAVEEAIMSFQDEGVNELFDEDSEEKKDEKAEEVLQNAPVTKLLGVIIKHAIEGKASDIHIEPVDKEYRVRFRVDGILHSSLSIPKEVGRAVVSRIKILSNLKIDERRKPQDGRFHVNENGRKVDFRVSTLPVIDGEKVVLRLLDKNSKTVDIESLGLLGYSKDVLLRHIRDPYGIILITGPTGSGKSTTLYAFLQILNKEERNIITLEDPVEYSVEGINQSQIKPEIGYTFASGLRSILRQDPNVIMVGEIRDGETAELSIHAALTGHLVFSTLHTNSAIGAVPRLMDMGIEPFLLTSSLQAVAAQRLVRRNCPDCCEEVKIPTNVLNIVKQEIDKISAEEIKKYDLDLSDGLKFYKGKGCDTCGKTGYKGRLAIYEVLEITDTIKDIITEHHGNELEITESSIKQGMLSLKQDGILKALKGFTTISEVERVTEGTLGGAEEDDKG